MKKSNYLNINDLTNWQKFLILIIQDFKRWVCLILIAQILRIIYVIFQINQITTNLNINEYFKALFTSARYDSKNISIIIFLSFLTSFLAIFNNKSIKYVSWFKNFITFFAICFYILMYLTQIGFYLQYGDEFNPRLLGFIYDDTKAIIITMIKEHFLIQQTIGLAFVSYLIFKLVNKIIFNKWFRGIINWKINKFITYRFSFSVIFLMLFIFAIRGSTTFVPLFLKDAGVTRDLFINKAVVDPINDVYYLISNFNALNSKEGLKKFTNKNIKTLVKQYSGINKDYKDIDQYFKHKVANNKIKPKHVFFVFGESLSSWPFFPEFSDWHIADDLKSLMKNGIYLDKFSSGSSGTIKSLSVAITGLANTNVFTNYQVSSYSPYKTSLAYQLKQHGIQTNFYYAGYASWHHLNSFTKNQGFEHMYSAAAIMQESTKKININEWGIDDGYLFDYIEKNFQPDIPSFNLILTITNHPPYDIKPSEMKKLGVDYDNIVTKFNQISSNKKAKDPNALKIGHYAYFEKKLSNFIKKMSTKYPDALFIITGDHFANKYPLAHRSQFVKRAVPLIIYGKDAKKLNLVETGSHINIPTTILELMLPKGTEYYSLSGSLLKNSTNKFTMNPSFGHYGTNVNDGVLYFQNGCKKDKFPKLIFDIDNKFANNKTDLKPVSYDYQTVSCSNTEKKLLDRYNNLIALSWWKIMIGNKID